MSAATESLRLALLGNPNCGKTALFNLLTGSRQKVEGVWKIANGASTIDPGACTDKEKAMKPDPKKWGLRK